MTITRVLVAHDAGARSFENHGPGKGLIALATVDFEDGRRHVGELDADRSGRNRDQGAFEPGEDAKTHAIAFFAKELARDLGREFRAGAFARLVLVAPPRFLGVLRAELDSLVTRAVIAAVPKALPRASIEELRVHLGPHLAC